MEVLPVIAGILVLGIGAQYLAWRLRLPSILLLLLTGFLAGPVTGFINPDALLGDFLLPLVGVSVAILLFEGGLALNYSDLRGHGKVVTSLVTMGALVTFLLGTIAALIFLDLSANTALLVGAVVVVSGPTVVMPLLRHVRPTQSVDAILRWEGILIDPVGALLAVLVFEAVSHGLGVSALAIVLPELGLSLLVGTLIGIGAAGLVVVLEKRYWLPDYLGPAVVLAMVVGAYALSEMVQHESGLLATTVMGVTLANQKRVNVRHILHFKENLSLILIGSLFILLAARVEVDALTSLLASPGLYAFLAVLVLVARPLVVAFATFKQNLELREKAFLAWMAPRGIVAAAVSALFALRLDSPDANKLVPIVFLVIVATVLLYGLTSRPVAKLLKVAGEAPQGVLIIGANQVSRAIGKILQDAKFKVILVDTDPQALTGASLDELTAVHGRAHHADFESRVNLDGMGRLFGLHHSDEVNTLAAVHMSEEFGRAMVYQVNADGQMPGHLRGRTLFGDITYQQLRDKIGSDDWSIRRTPITEQFGIAEHQDTYPNSIHLFIIHDKRLRVFAGDYRPTAEPGDVLVSLVRRPKVDKPVREEE